MSIPKLPGPVSAVMIFPEAIKVVDRLLSAYETGKKLDYELAALETNYRLEKRKLKIQKEALNNQHKQNMEFLAQQKIALMELLKRSQNDTKNYLETQKYWREQSSRIISVYLDDNTDSERRKGLLELHHSIAQRLADGAREYLNTDKNLLAQIRNSSRNQISENNK